MGLSLIKLAIEDFSAASIPARGSPPLTTSRRRELRNGIIATLPKIVPILIGTFRSSMEEMQNAIRVNGRCQIGLEIFDQLISWAPLRDYLNDDLFSCIFALAGTPSCAQSATAVSCLSAIINRNCMPPDESQFILGLAGKIMQILSEVLNLGAANIATLTITTFSGSLTS